MPFRVSFFFTQQADLLAGWSLNLWNNLSNINSIWTTAENLKDRFNNFTGTSTVIPRIRISDVAVFRKVVKRTYAVDPGPGSGAAGDSDFYTTAAQIKLVASESLSTTQWIRGVRDGDVTRGGRWTPTPSTTSALQAIKAILTNAGNGWSLRKLVPTTPKKKVTLITTAGVVTVPTHGYDGTLPVRLAQVKSSFNFNQLWSIVVLDSNTFQLVDYIAPSPLPTFTKFGTSQLQVKQYYAISDMFVSACSKHDTGRPFGLASGRRRARKK